MYEIQPGGAPGECDVLYFDGGPYVRVAFVGTWEECYNFLVSVEMSRMEIANEQFLGWIGD